MGAPAAVMGDWIVATCAIHQVPFSAPLVQGLATMVLIGGKPAAVQGSSGTDPPPHMGLGTVARGSTTVLIEGKPAAKTGSACTVCGQPLGKLVGSAATVLIGG
jgi:uncharacterized Zn-binding protein involved in type VI secretion